MQSYALLHCEAHMPMSCANCWCSAGIVLLCSKGKDGVLITGLCGREEGGFPQTMIS